MVKCTVSPPPPTWRSYHFSSSSRRVGTGSTPRVRRVLKSFIQRQYTGTRSRRRGPRAIRSPRMLTSGWPASADIGGSVPGRPTGRRGRPASTLTPPLSLGRLLEHGVQRYVTWASGRTTMKLGLHIASSDWEGGAPRLGAKLAEVVEAAEAAGFDTIDVADHVWQHPIMGGPELNEIEAYTTLGFIAARTRRVRLMALATAVPYRHAGLLAKMVTTLDVLSGGRVMLGLGAGDYEEEARGLGLPFPSLRERYELLEETVQVCLKMWAGAQGDGEPFAGKHVR